MVLTVDDIHNDEIVRQMQIQQLYKNICLTCFGEINDTVRYLRKNKMIFEVPDQIPDEPEYDFVSCLVYIINELRTSGFVVDYYKPNYLIISWENQRNRNRKIANAKFLLTEHKKTINKIDRGSSIKHIEYK